MHRQELLNGRVRVVYRSGTPAEVRKLLHPILERWAWALPPTCDELRIVFSPAATPDVEPTILAAMEVSTEYRMATMYVYGIWLQESPVAREATIVHELVHYLVGPLAEVLAELIDRTCADPTLKSWATECARRAEEASVCDITEALLRKRAVRSR